MVGLHLFQKIFLDKRRRLWLILARVCTIRSGPNVCADHRRAVPGGGSADGHRPIDPAAAAADPSLARPPGPKFAILAARVQAGTLPPPRRRTARPGCRPPSPYRLPRKFGLLIRLMPGSAACFGSQLQHFLAEPETTALLEAAPQAGRLFRPLCRMLAIPVPPSLRLPPRPARATPARATPAQPEPAIHPPRKIERGSVPKPPAAAGSPPEGGSGTVYVWRRWRGIRMPELWRPPKPA
jgi:hypothetical protein